MKKYLGIFLVSLIVAYLGLALRLPRSMIPRATPTEFERIRIDSWIQQGSKIKLQGLSARGNFLDIYFNLESRPAQLGVAQLEVMLCGKVVDSFSLTPENALRRVYLTGDCNPREVEFKSPNFFVPSVKDPRSLIIQVKEVRLASKLVLPVPAMRLVASAAVLVFLACSLWSFAVSKGLLFAIPVAALMLLSNAEFRQLKLMFPLWLFTVSLGAGIAVWRRHGKGQTVQPIPRSAWWIGLIVLLGAALRFYGLDYGLPSVYHADEPRKVNVILRMISDNTFDPRYFLHPTFLLYSSMFMHKLLSFLGITKSLFLAGRSVSCLAGTFSILITYLLGKRLFSERAALLGAAFLAVAPLHVTCSRYMKEDALFLFFVLLCALFVVKAVQERRVGILYLAALFAGLSASTKYTGLISSLIVFSAPWLVSRKIFPDKKFLVHTLLSGLPFLLGFLGASPYIILNFKDFERGFGAESAHMMRGHTIAITAWSHYWMYHFNRSLLWGFGHLPAILGVMALAYLGMRRRVEDLWIVGLMLLFYLPAEWVKAKPEPQPERYILGCLPFLALMVGELVANLKHRRLAQSLALVALVMPLARTLALASEIRNDTRSRLAAWMIQNLPAGGKYYVPGYSYGPQFHHGEFKPLIISGNKAGMFTVANLKASGVDYIVLPSLFYNRFFRLHRAHTYLRENIRKIFDGGLPLLAEFKPTYGSYGFHNPTIRIYKIK